MEKFTRHEGVGLPLRRSSVDTDQILPSKYLKILTRTGYEKALFSQWRESEDFILNQAIYADATVMVAGPDFGIGSSREAAVWALQDYGFRVIIAPRFGDIFRTNAGKSGLLTVELAEIQVNCLLDYFEGSPGATIEIDLERKRVVVGDWFDEGFNLDEDTRWRLLNALDEITITLDSEELITAFERRRPRIKPVIRAN